jgi:hypothetical protein
LTDTTPGLREAPSIDVTAPVPDPFEPIG